MRVSSAIHSSLKVGAVTVAFRHLEFPLLRSQALSERVMVGERREVSGANHEQTYTMPLSQ